MWRLEWDLNLRPSGRKARNLPLSHHALMYFWLALFSGDARETGEDIRDGGCHVERGQDRRSVRRSRPRDDRPVEEGERVDAGTAPDFDIVYLRVDAAARGEDNADGGRGTLRFSGPPDGRSGRFRRRLSGRLSVAFV